MIPPVVDLALRLIGLWVIFFWLARIARITLKYAAALLFRK